jgi:hypothetical protein
MNLRSICFVNDIYYLYQSENEDKEKILEVTTEVAFGDIEFENLINSAYEYYKPSSDYYQKIKLHYIIYKIRLF